jgi:glucosamine--fructose-6-phosphate aminotransferase (isomerizing)
MCGIVGYIGNRPLWPVLLEGLRRLEYRGYDSAGIVYFRERDIEITKIKGRVYDLEERLYRKDTTGVRAPGLGHTRWATHGEPSDENAHPHFDCSKKLALVHNGIIENYYVLKERLLKKGHAFVSATDTEVMAHLIEDYLSGGYSLWEAFLKTLQELQGAFAIALISKEEPEKIYVARYQSPLVIGLGEEETLLASDIPALLPFTKRVVFLQDRECAILSKEGLELFDFEGRSKEYTETIIHWDLSQAEKGGFPHFMLKEIFEQPQALQNTLLGRVSLEDLEIDLSLSELHWLRDIERIYIVACGTSYHAGLVGKFYLERYTRLPVEVELASEFRYRDPILDERCLFIGISQSGETADTLASLRLAKEKGAKILSICNVLGSSITRESEVVLYTQAGPEISVASTKAFTTQVLMILLLSLYIYRIRTGQNHTQELVEKLLHLPVLLKEFMDETYPRIREISKRWYQAKDFLYLGRNILYPIALEGALKLKEISYIHAEGYAAGEMKHGPIALIEESFPTIILAAKETGLIYEKTLSNAEEIRSRRGPLLGVITQGSEEFRRLCEDYLEVPPLPYEFLPIFYVVPLQLLAYEMAVLRGCDVDRPRNLAKSVTVE